MMPKRQRDEKAPPPTRPVKAKSSQGDETATTMPRTRTITPKQQRFVEEYLVDLNATQAAIRAGFSPKYAASQGLQLLHKTLVSAAIQAGRKRLTEKSEVTQERVLTEMALVAFADMAHYVTFDENGNVHLDWSHMPKGATQVIAEITQEEYSEGRGEDAREVKRTKFKLHPKLPALEGIRKMLGYDAPSKTEEDVNVRYSVEHYTTAELVAHIVAERRRLGLEEEDGEVRADRVLPVHASGVPDAATPADAG